MLKLRSFLLSQRWLVVVIELLGRNKYMTCFWLLLLFFVISVTFSLCGLPKIGLLFNLVQWYLFYLMFKYKSQIKK